IVGQGANGHFQQADALNEPREGGELAVLQEPSDSVESAARCSCTVITAVRCCIAVCLAKRATRLDGLEQRAQQRHRACHVTGDAPPWPRRWRVAGEAFGRREDARPGRPLPADRRVHHADEGGWLERVLPIDNRARSRIAIELGITLAYQAEGVLVKSHPEVQPVLLDTVGAAPA